MLSPTILPADLSKDDLVHVTQKADALLQLSFIQACRQRGAKQISAGTYPGDVVKQPQAVRAILEQSDYFFMNDLEANWRLQKRSLAREKRIARFDPQPAPRNVFTVTGR